MASTARKLKVAFVRGPIICVEGSINNEATPCIAFAYLAGYIRPHGYETVVVDAIAEGLNQLWPVPKYPGYVGHGLTFGKTLAMIPPDTDVLAFSGMFSSEWPMLRDLVAAARERFPDALFVAGGEHVTALPEYSLRDCRALDCVVRGEGEATLLALLECRLAGGDMSQVFGLSFLDRSGAYCESGGLPRIKDADSIPWPHWPEGYLEKFWAAGKSYGVSTERDMPFMASRGCPYRCTFCSNPQMWTTRYVLRDPADCVAEIKSYIERYDITSLQFYDLTAVTKKAWIMDFCRLLIEQDVRLSWSLPSGTRSEVLDAETLAIMKRTGCSYLVYAPESGSERTLVRIKKKIRLSRLVESVYEALRQGINVRTNLIIGFPGEGRLDVYKTLLFGLRMAVNGVDEAPVFLFMPYPGSEIFRDLANAGLVKPSDAYFLSLNSLNGKYMSLKSLSFNETMGPGELVVYRTIFMAANYLLSYLLYPKRILRTLRSFGSTDSATVLEHRLKDALRRRKAQGKAEDRVPVPPA